MEKFDLVAPRKGATVCTREGYPATILTFDNRDPRKPITAEFENEFYEKSTCGFYADGRFCAEREDDLDLMMKDDDYREKLARGEYDASESRIFAPYLPYGLYVFRTILGRQSLIGGNTEWRIYPGFFKNNVPILRPMSQLTQEISERRYNNGEPFIPIVELAKAWAGAPISDYRILRCGVFYVGIEMLNTNRIFSWWMQDHRFDASWSGDCGPAAFDPIVINQTHELYDLLHQWHFDYRGLIEQGKALSAADGDIDLYSEM